MAPEQGPIVENIDKPMHKFEVYREISPLPSHSPSTPPTLALLQPILLIYGPNPELATIPNMPSNYGKNRAGRMPCTPKRERRTQPSAFCVRGGSSLQTRLRLSNKMDVAAPKVGQSAMDSCCPWGVRCTNSAALDPSPPRHVARFMEDLYHTHGYSYVQLFRVVRGPVHVGVVGGWCFGGWCPNNWRCAQTPQVRLKTQICNQQMKYVGVHESHTKKSVGRTS